MMTIRMPPVNNNSYNISKDVNGYKLSTPANDMKCLFSTTLQSLVKYYRSSSSFQDSRQLTVAASRARLDFKTSSVIREQEEGILHILELPIFLDAGADLGTRAIYTRCYSVYKKCKNYKPAETFFTRLLKYAPFYQKSTPRVVMFGPGLESNTSSIAHKLLWNGTSPFQVQHMFPGLQDGVGCGMSLKYQGSQIVNLITLYSPTRKEREAAARDGIQSRNKILLDQKNEKEGSLILEVSHSVRQLCKTIDAFIFVVDSSTSREKVSENNDLLASMMDERWTSQKAPLLVLSCSLSAAKEPHLNCVDVVEKLKLCDVNRHWQVVQVVVETLEGIDTGMNWILEECSS